MDAEEKEICEFLKSCPGQSVASHEICRRAGGKWRFRKDPNWAIPVLARLVEQGELETNASGHFRLRPRQKREREKWWLSPQMKKILQDAGRKFEEGDDVDKATDPEQR